MNNDTLTILVALRLVEILGGGVERDLGLDGDVPVLAAVVAITDDAKAGFDPHGLDGAHGSRLAGAMWMAATTGDRSPPAISWLVTTRPAPG
jgi:hypothetical protein